jgi:hypothetical protein
MTRHELVSRFRHAPLVAAIVVLGVATPPKSAYSAGSFDLPVAPDSTPPRPFWSRDTLTGRSGKLWMKLIASRPADSTSLFSRIFGDSAAKKPGVYVARDNAKDSGFTFVNLVPFSEKKKGMLGSYRMGSWPAERRDVSSAYGNPDGFIQVTPENQDTRISEHFRLRDFLTKDQAKVWPKYLVLREGLIDKLELVIGALNARGIVVSRMSVMSGFRTPQYNDQGVGSGGRAQNSRHQYGDAADVYVDSDGDGQMDDVNRDGKVNTKDAQFLARVVDEIEQAHPELTGGVGVYPGTSTHGPFVHVDVRGIKARW